MALICHLLALVSMTIFRRISINQAMTPDTNGRTNWVGGPADYFRDARAHQVGDLVTVKVSMNDNAKFDISTDGQRKASYAGSATAATPLPFLNGTGSLNSSLSATNSGQGTVQRSEKLNIAVAAIVRQVLPNGSLVVQGSQETLVNYEKRIVRISGIVDPRNIAPDNSIEYDRIAEARIAYGGSGNVNDQQRPHWGMQIWNKLNPF